MKSMIDDLAAQAWAWNPRFLDESECQALLDLWSRVKSSAQPARISKQKRFEPGIRGDSILWLDEIQDRNPTERDVLQSLFLTRVSEIREQMNRDFFLGLLHFEGHFAYYPSGAGYQAHYDQPRHSDGHADSARVISMVLYLNPDWKPGDGGELVLWKDESRSSARARIEPRGGGAVLFRSDEIYHEVLPTSVPRLSLTGWFRRETPTQIL